MKQVYRKFFLVPIFLFTLLASTLTFSATTFAAACAGQDGIMGVRAWYYNLCNADGNVAIDQPLDAAQQLAINVLTIALMVGGYIAVGFVIWGGLQYILAAGDSGKIAGAKTTIQNALIGLLISLSAVAIITLVLKI